MRSAPLGKPKKIAPAKKITVPFGSHPSLNFMSDLASANRCTRWPCHRRQRIMCLLLAYARQRSPIGVGIIARTKRSFLVCLPLDNIPAPPRNPGTMQSGGNTKTLFTKFEYTGEKPRPRKKVPEIKGPKFKPISNIKGKPTTSISTTNINRSMNSSNFASISCL